MKTINSVIVISVLTYFIFLNFPFKAYNQVVQGTSQDRGQNPVPLTKIILNNNSVSSDTSSTTADEYGYFHITYTSVNDNDVVVNGMGVDHTNDLMKVSVGVTGQAYLFNILGQKVHDKGVKLNPGLNILTLNNFSDINTPAAGVYLLKVVAGDYADVAKVTTLGGYDINGGTRLLTDGSTELHGPAKANSETHTLIGKKDGYYQSEVQFTPGTHFTSSSDILTMNLIASFISTIDTIRVQGNDTYDLNQHLDDDLNDGYWKSDNPDVSVIGGFISAAKEGTYNVTISYFEKLLDGFFSDTAISLSTVVKRVDPVNTVTIGRKIIDTYMNGQPNPDLQGWAVASNAPGDTLWARLSDGYFEMVVQRNTTIDKITYGYKNLNGDAWSFVRRELNIDTGADQSDSVAVLSYEGGIGDNPQEVRSALCISNFLGDPRGAKPVMPDMKLYLVRDCQKQGAYAYTDNQWQRLIEIAEDFRDNYYGHPLEIVIDGAMGSGFYPKTDAEARGKILIYREPNSPTDYRIDPDGTRFFVEAGVFDPLNRPQDVYKALTRAIIMAIGTIESEYLRDKTMLEGSTTLQKPGPLDEPAFHNFWWCVANKVGKLRSGMPYWNVLIPQ